MGKYEERRGGRRRKWNRRKRRSQRELNQWSPRLQPKREPYAEERAYLRSSGVAGYKDAGGVPCERAPAPCASTNATSKPDL